MRIACTVACLYYLTLRRKSKAVENARYGLRARLLQYIRLAEEIPEATVLKEKNWAMVDKYSDGSTSPNKRPFGQMNQQVYLSCEVALGMFRDKSLTPTAELLHQNEVQWMYKISLGKIRAN